MHLTPSGGVKNRFKMLDTNVYTPLLNLPATSRSALSSRPKGSAESFSPCFVEQL
jgi:hypothetical protein